MNNHEKIAMGLTELVKGGGCLLRDMSLLIPVVAGMMGVRRGVLIVHCSLAHPDFCDVGLDVGRDLVCRRESPEPSREKLLQWAQ